MQAPWRQQKAGHMRRDNLQERRSFTEPCDLGRPALTVAYDHIGNALVGWIEADRRARLLVDSQLRAWWVSPAADELMRRTGALLIRNGHVHTSEQRFKSQLRDLVHGATEELSLQCIHDQRVGEPVVITAQRLSAPSDHLVGVTLQSANENFAFRLADLQQAFGFTRTEERVAFHLLCGRTANETAQHLKVSLETVRTHIKRSYGKLGVSSREAFFHRLTPFIVPLV